MFRDIKKVLAIACVTMAVSAATIPSIVSAQNSTPNSAPSRTEKRSGDGDWAGGGAEREAEHCGDLGG